MKYSIVVTMSILMCFFATSAHAVQYLVSDIGLADNSSVGYLKPLAINNSGDVAYSIGGKAAVYSHGVSSLLGALGGSNYSYASSINDSGNVVGLSNQLAFEYSSGQMTSLGILKLGQMPQSEAVSINNIGQVVGMSTTGNLVNGNNVSYHAVSFASSITDLGTLGGYYSVATSINDSGVSVGWSTTQPGTGFDSMRPFVYANGSMLNLGTLGGASYLGAGQASAINNDGMVVGYSALTNAYGRYSQHAFLYSGNTMSDLGTLNNAYFGATSRALDINANGQIVGTSSFAANALDHAFAVTNGLMVDLNGLIQPNGWELTSAQAINDAGQIAGFGQLGGATHAFLLTPVPEPETYSLMLAGFGLLGLLKRRKNQLVA